MHRGSPAPPNEEKWRRTVETVELHGTSTTTDRQLPGHLLRMLVAWNTSICLQLHPQSASNFIHSLPPTSSTVCLQLLDKIVSGSETSEHVNHLTKMQTECQTARCGGTVLWTTGLHVRLPGVGELSCGPQVSM